MTTGVRTTGGETDAVVVLVPAVSDEEAVSIARAVVEERLASQPTQSRLIDILTLTRDNRAALRDALSESCERHLRATGGDRAARGSHRVREPAGQLQSFAFTGIHVIDPKIFSLSDRESTFSIITLYLELAALGHRILPIDVSSFDWIDVGTRERLAEAEAREW